MLRPDPLLTMKESSPPASCREGTSPRSSEQRPRQLWLLSSYHPPPEHGEGKRPAKHFSLPPSSAWAADPSMAGSSCSPGAEGSRGWGTALWLRPWPYLAEQGGVLAGMGLQKDAVWLACAKCQPQVPRH